MVGPESASTPIIHGMAWRRLAAEAGGEFRNRILRRRGLLGIDFVETAVAGRPEIGKLACQAEGARLFAEGEIPGGIVPAAHGAATTGSHSPPKRGLGTAI